MPLKEIYIFGRLFILSDIHGELAVIYSYITRFDLENCIILQVGDFGYGFKGEQLSKLDYYLKSQNVTLLINRGNHDNYYNHHPELGSPYYNHEPHIGAKEYHQLLSNIKFLPDYSVINWKINSGYKRILTIGGATSIDRIDREKNISWWEDEGIRHLSVCSIHDKQKIIKISPHNAADKKIDNLINSQYFDIVVSHSAPLLFYPYIKLGCLDERYKKDPNLKEDLDKDAVYLNSMFNRINPEKYYFGHYHQSVRFDMGVQNLKSNGIPQIGIKGCDIRGLNINELVEVNY